jgi:hypothetical protein
MIAFSWLDSGFLQLELDHCAALAALPGYISFCTIVSGHVFLKPLLYSI